MKKNKTLIKGLKVLGILAIIFLLANLGVNLWLKYKLPDFIKNNTDYKVEYKALTVDVVSGNIQSTNIKVNSKNLDNVDVIGLDGTIDQLTISRLGIFDALFRKKISSTDIILENPNLKIQLAKPIESKTGKSRNPVSFDNITINNGFVEIFRHTKQKFFSVKNLKLFVENLQMTEESVEDKLPFVFDHYDIKGNDFFLQPNDAYVLSINNITTKDGEMRVNDLKLTSQLSVSDFKNKFPKQNQMFNVDVKQMDFKDVDLVKNKISLSNATLLQPIIKITQISKAVKKNPKPSKLEANLGNISVKDGIFMIENTSGEKVVNAENMNLDVKKLVFDETTSGMPIPVVYDDFKFSCKNASFVDGNQKFQAEAVNFGQKNGNIKNLIASTSGSNSNATSMDMSVNWIQFDFNEFKFVDKKLKLDVKSLYLNGVNGEIHSKPHLASKKKKDFSKIQFPITVRNIEVRNSNLTIANTENSWKLDRLNVVMNNLQALPKKNGEGLSYKIGYYNITSANVLNSSKFYSVSLGLLKVNASQIQINNFAMKPKFSRSQFISMIPTERDLYTLSASQINAKGKWDFLSENKSILASSVLIDGVKANIFRSKTPKDDPKIKPMYSKMLRSISIPMFVDHLDIKNSSLEYEEDKPDSNGPGKLSFGNFNMNVRNLNSAKMKGKPTKVLIKVNCAFMNASPMNVDWNFDVANPKDQFHISGTVSDLPAPRINPFVEPYLNVTLKGVIQQMVFNFDGNHNGLSGKFNLKHKGLKVSILDKDTKIKKKALSSIANLFIKTNSGDFPESVDVKNVQRDPTKSFFNLLWKGVQAGLKTTLVGDIDVKVKKAKEDIKNAKKDVKEVTNEVKSKVQDIKNSAQEKKKKGGVFRRVFNKKNKETTEE